MVVVEWDVEVDRATLDEAGADGVVDGVAERVVRVDRHVNEHNSSGRDLLAHLRETLVLPAGEVHRVVHERVDLLQLGAGRADEVHDGEALGRGAGNAAERAELADAEGGDADGEVVLDARIAVGSVSLELGIALGMGRRGCDVEDARGAGASDATQPGRATRNATRVRLATTL